MRSRLDVAMIMMQICKTRDTRMIDIQHALSLQYILFRQTQILRPASKAMAAPNQKMLSLYGIT